MLSHTYKYSDTALLMGEQLIQGWTLSSLMCSWDKLQHARCDPASDPKKGKNKQRRLKEMFILHCSESSRWGMSTINTGGVGICATEMKYPSTNIYSSLENKGQPTRPHRLFWLNTSNRKWTRALQSGDDTVCVFDFKHIKRSMGGKL